MVSYKPQRSGKSATATTGSRDNYNAELTHSTVCSALSALGFEHLEKVPHRGTARIPSRGKGPNNTSTSLTISADGEAAHWCEFTTGEKGTIFADNVPGYDQEEAAKRFRQAEIHRRKAEHDKQITQQLVTTEARKQWQQAVAIGSHTYIQKKRLSGLLNARLDKRSGALLIPMIEAGNGLVNLQRIYPDGTKRFMKGGRVKAAYSVIGCLSNATRVIVCEGWATGATMFEQYGLPIIVAFNAGNLMPVCQALRSRFSDIAVVIAADDDRLNRINTGRQKAIVAADAIGATLLFPKLCKCCLCTDHNDAALCARRCSHG